MAVLTVQYLLLGGGGANAQAYGGAGGYVEGTTSINSASSYPVIIGALGGGANQYPQYGNGNNGGNTTFNGITAYGGGGGGSRGGCSCSTPPGSDGASGGGGSYDNATHAGGNAIYGAQGFAGGLGRCFTGQGCWVGGGGGAGGAAPDSAGSRGTVTAGIGRASSITGTSVTYATGGGQINHQNTPGSGGTNDGYLVVRYTNATQLFAGGTVSQVGGDWVHIFTTSGTLTGLSGVFSGYGGNGGNLGQAGSAGGSNSGGTAGAVGGVGGYAVRYNGNNVVVSNSGTINGSTA